MREMNFNSYGEKWTPHLPICKNSNLQMLLKPLKRTTFRSHLGGTTIILQGPGRAKWSERRPTVARVGSRATRQPSDPPTQVFGCCVFVGPSWNSMSRCLPSVGPTTSSRQRSSPAKKPTWAQHPPEKKPRLPCPIRLPDICLRSSRETAFFNIGKRCKGTSIDQSMRTDEQGTTNQCIENLRPTCLRFM